MLKEKNELNVSQKQAVIKLIEENDRDKQYIKNLRAISLTLRYFRKLF